MPSICERDGRFRVQIRKRGINISSTFSDFQTAELWGLYKESLIEEIYAFEVPNEELISLADAIALKVIDLKEHNKDKKTIDDCLYCLKDFEVWIDKPISYFTYDLILEKSKQMSNEIVRYGGYGDKGNMRIQSSSTILRKIRSLSSVFTLMVEKGFIKSNPVFGVLTYLNSSVKSCILSGSTKKDES